jgi:hypothetical protein
MQEKSSEGCKCGGYKLTDEQRKKDETNIPSPKDLCSNPNCNHTFGRFSLFFVLFRKLRHLKKS